MDLLAMTPLSGFQFGIDAESTNICFPSDSPEHDDGFLDNFGGGGSLDALAQACDQREKLRERRRPINYCESQTKEPHQEREDTAEDQEYTEEQESQANERRPSSKRQITLPKQRSLEEGGEPCRKRGRPCGTKTDIQRLLRKEDPPEDVGAIPPVQPPSNHVFTQQRAAYYMEKERRKRAGLSLEGLREPQRPYSEYQYWVTELVPWLAKRVNWLEHLVDLPREERRQMVSAPLLPPSLAPPLQQQRAVEERGEMVRNLQQQLTEVRQERTRLLEQHRTKEKEHNEAMSALQKQNDNWEKKVSQLQGEAARARSECNRLAEDKRVLQARLEPFLERAENESKRKNQDLSDMRDLEQQIREQEKLLQAKDVEIYKQQVRCEEMQKKWDKYKHKGTLSSTATTSSTTTEEEISFKKQAVDAELLALKAELVPLAKKFDCSTVDPSIETTRSLIETICRYKDAQTILRDVLDSNTNRLQVEKDLLAKQIKKYEVDQARLCTLAKRFRISPGAEDWVFQLERACFSPLRSRITSQEQLAHTTLLTRAQNISIPILRYSPFVVVAPNKTEDSSAVVDPDHVWKQILSSTNREKQLDLESLLSMYGMVQCGDGSQVNDGTWQTQWQVVPFDLILHCNAKLAWKMLRARLASSCDPEKEAQLRSLFESAFRLMQPVK